MDVFCTVIDIFSVCGSIPIEIPILWPRAVMVGSRPRVLLTLPLVVIINNLKVPKIKKILLYEVKFLVPNYSCLQNP